MGIEGIYLNIVKAYMISLQQALLSMVKTESIPLRSGMRQGSPLSPLLCNTGLEVLATAIREEKEIKGIQIGKEEARISLFESDMTDDMTLYIYIKKH